MADEPDSMDKEVKPPDAADLAERQAARRNFFRDAAAGIAGPLMAFLGDRFNLDAIEQQLRKFDEPGEFNLPALRPPGALAGEAFLGKCNRCGDCAKVCRAAAIVMDPYPRIEPQRQGCVLCKDLPCIAACKTGALEPVEMGHVVMGLALWDPSLCRRFSGQECEICLNACPAAGALKAEGNAITVNGMHCTGCGMCEYLCPTRPRAITIQAF